MTSKKKHKHGDLKRIDEESFNEEVTYIDEKDVEIIFENEEKIHKKFKSKGPIKKYLETAKRLFEMVKDYKNGNYREMPWYTIASVVMVMLYVLNPFDIITDLLPIVGYVDDAGVLALALKLIKNDFDGYLVWRGLKEAEEE
ncbi:MAG: YkvA family protein [Bacteroidota bacterium]